MWFPCWDGCDPHEVNCGEAFGACETVQPCVGRCKCPAAGLVFLTGDGRCVHSYFECDCEYL